MVKTVFPDKYTCNAEGNSYPIYRETYQNGTVDLGCKSNY